MVIRRVDSIQPVIGISVGRRRCGIAMLELFRGNVAVIVKYIVKIGQHRRSLFGIDIRLTVVVIIPMVVFKDGWRCGLC